MRIPLCKPSVSDEEVGLVEDVLRSGWLAHGAKNKEFEENFAKYVGVKRAVSLNSCTSALQLAIQSHGVKGEIILPSFTFVASANSVVTSGAKPVFVDVDFDTCNIDPAKIEKAITEDTRAIMPVHFAGQSCKMKEIMEIAGKNDLIVIEDSAETLGGEYNGQKTGSFGTGCFSFYPTKNITTGEGGMVTTNDDKIAERITALRAHGITSSAFEREKKEKSWMRAASFAGYNYRLCDVLAAIGVVQLKKVDRMNELRRRHAAYLNKRLDFEGIKIPVELKECKHVYQMYTVKLDDSLDRGKFIAELRERGVEASVHFDPPVHLQPYYKKFSSKGLFVTEELSKRIVTLPMYPDLTKEELEYMVRSIEEALKGL